MRQQGANVGDIWKIARLPQSPAKSHGGEHAADSKDRLRAGEPGSGEQGFAAGRSAIRSALLLDAGYDGAMRISSGGQTGKV